MFEKYSSSRKRGIGGSDPCKNCANMVQVAKLAAAGDYDALQKYLQEVQTWLVWKLFSVLSMKCSGSSVRKVLRTNCVSLMQSACAGRSESKLLQRLGVSICILFV